MEGEPTSDSGGSNKVGVRDAGAAKEALSRIQYASLAIQFQLAASFCYPEKMMRFEAPGTPDGVLGMMVTYGMNNQRKHWRGRKEFWVNFDEH